MTGSPESLLSRRSSVLRLVRSPSTPGMGPAHGGQIIRSQRNGISTIKRVLFALWVPTTRSQVWEYGRVLITLSNAVFVVTPEVLEGLSKQNPVAGPHIGTCKRHAPPFCSIKHTRIEIALLDSRSLLARRVLQVVDASAGEVGITGSPVTWLKARLSSVRLGRAPSTPGMGPAKGNNWRKATKRS